MDMDKGDSEQHWATYIKKKKFRNLQVLQIISWGPQVEGWSNCSKLQYWGPYFKFVYCRTSQAGNSDSFLTIYFKKIERSGLPCCDWRRGSEASRDGRRSRVFLSGCGLSWCESPGQGLCASPEINLKQFYSLDNFQERRGKITQYGRCRKT